jgi:cellulose synthase/poly-beta-1,6-N-acetylglucosamine synthase-like glycosyltransferase
MLQQSTLSFEKGHTSPETNDTYSNIYFEEVERYAAWLAADSKGTSAAWHREETREYIESALTTVRVGGKEVALFAPFRREFSAMQTFTRGQVFAISMIGVVGLLGLLFFHVGLLVIAIAVITFLYLSDLIINSLLTVWTLKQSVEEHIDDAVVHALADADWPRYTILCPLYREAEVVPQFVEAMLALDYPMDRLQILLLTEEDDASTRQAILAQRLPRHFTVVTVPDGKPRTKPRACNYGLLRATGDYVVIYDAEDIPDPLQLKKAVLTFANRGPETACVQAKLNFYNTRQNLLTRWFTAEYSLWFDLTLPGLQRLGVPLPLGGTSNHFRAHMLRLMGAWDAFNVTEDCDLGLRMVYYGFKTAMLDSTTYEEANSQLKNWIRQRSRWIKGYMQTYLVYMRRPQRYLRSDRLREFFSLQLFVGGKTFVLLVNPFMWLLVVLYVLVHPIDLYHTLFPAPILYMSAACLIFGNFFYTYTHLIGCMKRGYFSLVKWTLFIPVYWAMASVASFMALQQLILKPHYWEKTMHGLHLHPSGSTIVMEEDESMEDTLRLPAAVLRTLHRPPSTPWPDEETLEAIKPLPNVTLTTEVVELEEFELELIEKTVQEKTAKLRVRSRMKYPSVPLQPGEFEFDREETTVISRQQGLWRPPRRPRPAKEKEGAPVSASERAEPL